MFVFGLSGFQSKNRLAETRSLPTGTAAIHDSDTCRTIDIGKLSVDCFHSSL